MVAPRRFVRLVDAIAGRFDRFIEAAHEPPPYRFGQASTLDQFMSSFYTEIFDWTLADATHVGSTTELATLPGPDALRPEAVDDCKRSRVWKIRLYGRLRGHESPIAVIGFDSYPPMTSSRLYKWTYLLMSPSSRIQRWRIVGQDGSQLDWRSMDIVSNGDFQILLDGETSDVMALGQEDHADAQQGQHMLVEFDRPETLFLAKSAAVHEFNSARSSVSSPSGSQAGRSCTPKNEVRGRDVRCLISGGEDYLLLGRDKVAHILPHSQPFLSDKVRFVFDPSRFQGHRSPDLRARCPNHPMNLIILRSKIEEQFDEMRLVVDPFEDASPTVISVQRADGYSLSDGERAFLLGSRPPFPPLPYEANGVPGPSAVCLGIHLLSALGSSCRLRMTDESDFEPEEGRSNMSSSALSEQIEDWLGELEDCAGLDEDLLPALDRPSSPARTPLHGPATPGSVSSSVSLGTRSEFNRLED